MTAGRWYPVDSTEAREQREAEADREAGELEEQRRHDDECADGWRGEDLDGRPIPCATCRPHLASPGRCSVCGTASDVCDSQRARYRGPCCDACHHPAGVAR